MHPLLEGIPGINVRTVFFKEFEGRLFTSPTEKEKEIFGDLMAELKPDLVGFSVFYPFFPITKTLVKLVRDHSPSSLVILGGVHPTTNPEQCIQEADMICVGDGEDALIELVEALRDGVGYHFIGNLWVKHDGDIVRNPLRPLRQDLDSLPFPSYCNDAYYFIDKDTLTKKDPLPAYNDLYVIASRGCPYSCSFCGNPVLRSNFKGLGHFIRRRSVDSIIREIKESLALPDNRTNYIYFFDENFNLDLAWLDEFCLKYKAEIGLPFQVSYNPHRLGLMVVDKLVEVGLDSLRFGFQTGSDTVRRQVYNRPGKNAEIIDFTNKVARHKIVMRHDLILDNPYETEKDLEEGIDLLLQLPKESAVDVYSLRYYPNYPITKRAVEDKIIPPLEEMDDRAIEGTSTDVGYTPRFSPRTKKQMLQNIIWLITGRHVKEAFVRYGVFGHSLGSALCLYYMNAKAVLLGKIIGDGGIASKYPFIMYCVKGIGYLSKGDWKGFRVRVERRLGLKRTYYHQKA
jgi:radical SAM superfamily enzyme YgiQ (UPF0313 family)